MKQPCIYRIDSEDRIIYINEAWYPFALENDAEELHEKNILFRPLWNFISNGQVREIYRNIIKKIRETERSVTVPLNCDSPDCRRFMELVLSPGVNKEIEFKCQLVRLEFRDPQLLLEKSNLRSDDLLPMCSWCKKILWTDDWIEIEEAVARMKLLNGRPIPMVTHSICPNCLKIMGTLTRK